MELVRLIHHIDEHECARRNALANTPAGFVLRTELSVLSSTRLEAMLTCSSSSAPVDLITVIGSACLRAFELEFLPEAARPLDERFQKSKCNNSVVVLIFESAVS